MNLVGIIALASVMSAVDIYILVKAFIKNNNPAKGCFRAIASAITAVQFASLLDAVNMSCWGSNVLGYIFNFVILVGFAYGAYCCMMYLEVLNRSYMLKRPWIHIVFIIPVVAYAVLCAISCVTGLVYTVDSAGVYYRGPLYFLQIVVPFLYIAASCLRIIATNKSRWIVRTLLVYAVPTAAGAVVQAFIPMGFSAAGASIGILLLYIEFYEAEARKAEIRRKVDKVNAELKKSNEALEETNEIIGNAGYGIWHILMKKGKKSELSGNGKFFEFLGLNPDELTGEELFDFWNSRIVGDDITAVRRNTHAMMAGNPCEITYRWNHPTKGIVYIRIGGAAEKLGENEYLFGGFYSDVTDIVSAEHRQKELLRKALADAEHANRAKTVFLNNMSHDIRTPMNAIIGFTALAAGHTDDKAAVQNYLSKISTSSHQLLMLINDVLDMSRIEGGGVRIEKNEVHIPDVLHDLRTVVQPTAAAKQLDLFIDVQDIVHENVITDRLKINQILNNIVSNAIKYTPAGGEINISVRELPCQIEDSCSFEFRVKDNGIGMSDDFRKHVFEAFSRENSSTVSGIQGTGLGMAITKNIVDMMGGTIGVESKLGVGSVFTINLPLRINGKAASDEPIDEFKDLRAMVLCDNCDTCTDIAKMLSQLGMRSEWTVSGNEAVSRAKSALEQNDRFNVYVIDWLLSDMNGLQAVGKLKEAIGESESVIILTAYDWSGVEGEAREAGVTAFCTKPVFISELREALTAACRNEKQEPENEKNNISFYGRKLLLAEDNELNREIAVELLSEYGFEVDCVINGASAVSRIKSVEPGTYELILMDIQMPVMDGYEAARRIRNMEDKKTAAIPIIAMTANAFEEDKKKALGAGMNGHVAKPIDMEKLIGTISQFIRQ